MNDFTTLWVRTEGTGSLPLLCAAKAEALAAGAELDAFRITIGESEWTPCCRAYINHACVRDLEEPDDETARRVIRISAARAGITLPDDIE